MRGSRLFVGATAALALTAGAARAEVKLPAVFGDHMVLQEGRKVPFWGTAEPGEKVTVEAAGATGSATADAAGRWRVDLPALEKREPFTVTVRGKNTVTYSDVVTGEVWLASGQSNMEWPLQGTLHGGFELEKASHPRLRLFQVEKPKTFAETPKDVDGRWAAATPATAAGFSAIGYFFGRALIDKLDRPIGIIHTSWGGTPAEAWTTRKTLAAHPQLKTLVAPVAGQPKDLVAATRAFEEESARYRNETAIVDPGNKGEAQGWAGPGPSNEGWDPMYLPQLWENDGLDVDGAVWFRKEIEIPAAWVGKALTLHLGPISNCDTTYVGGQKVGATCKETPRTDVYPRRYAVPAALVRKPRLLIAVRVWNERGKGGFAGTRDDLRLVLGDSADGPHVNLRGEWRYRIEAKAPVPPNPPRPKAPPGLPNQNTAGVLWDGMVAPLVPYAIRGAIWYQGESNTKRAYQYRALFPTMIQDWRRAFAQGDFPFLFVQLSSYHPRWPGPGQRSDEEWAELREAQTMTLKLPHTGMAVTTDIGDPNDIHPRNKQDVGKRLALIALAQTYGQEIEYSGPMYSAISVEKGGRVRVRFKHADGLAAAGAPGEPLVGFEVAGRDRRYVAAEAHIDGDSIVLSAPTVPAPVAARYAWSDAPLGNLINRAGLPASPFRTDTWPGLTAGRH